MSSHMTCLRISLLVHQFLSINAHLAQLQQMGEKFSILGRLGDNNKLDQFMVIISGHLGWVRSVAVDPSNNWFCTGSADRTIKIWDLASGRVKLTLTGHIDQVRGLAISSKHTYMFSAGDDKLVKCWDLEQNKVIRSSHGHLNGVYCLALHPTIDILFTGGRDSVCRVWDTRSKMQIHALSGHENTVCSVFTRPTVRLLPLPIDATIPNYPGLQPQQLQMLLTMHVSLRGISLQLDGVCS
ncbi:Protein pleiotropic regulatory locus 1 [Striga hermonthica]|uniref:Protein pleiotropic regulatory locus 1 n=1 Tax=Striga hermonthica TaxID=68872 RepID=A0A9N7NK13_STRHE|nr:Protein pleiotropic regulatory locus 1 [Striga hermonthica]